MLTTDVPNFPTASPAAILEIFTDDSRLLPLDIEVDRYAKTVSPAPETSNTSFASEGR